MTPFLAQVTQTTWDWDVFWEHLPALVRGMRQTVVATLVGITIGMILGLVLALLRRSSLRIVSWPVRALIEFVRSTPLLVQLFFIFFVLPGFGLSLSSFVSLVTGLGVHYGAYTSESYRAGIDSVERGQWEASVALNLSPSTTWTRVILPQAIPTVIPALGNYLVAMLKDAPLAIGIGAGGILVAATTIQGRFLDVLEPFITMGALFLAVSIPGAMFARYLEKRYGYERT